MIRKTLSATKDATFCIELPNAAKGGMPAPAGTGFFVSADGWFLTAAHVVFDRTTKSVRTDIADAWLRKEGSLDSFPGAMCQFPELVEFMPQIDVALLKVDWDKNKEKAWLKDRKEFPYVVPSALSLEEGEPVYAFGYPLSDSALHRHDDQMTWEVHHYGHELRPRLSLRRLNRLRFS